MRRLVYRITIKSISSDARLVKRCNRHSASYMHTTHTEADETLVSDNNYVLSRLTLNTHNDFCFTLGMLKKDGIINLVIHCLCKPNTNLPNGY